MKTAQHISKLLLLFCICLQSWAEQQSYNEDLLPFKTEFKKDYTVDNTTTITAGTRCIILRPVGIDQLLIEIPRRGVFEVPLSSTNVGAAMADSELTEELRAVPRMSYFFANRIISGESGWQYPVRTEVVTLFNRWIIIYGNSNEPLTLEAIRCADTFYQSLVERERKETSIVYMDPSGSKGGIQKIAERLEPSIQSMPAYLSKGYSKTLQHLEDDLSMPVLVEVKSSGRIVERVVGVKEICSFLGQ
jgi:hypothetical protein